jgi:hypothetical protein
MKGSSFAMLEIKKLQDITTVPDHVWRKRRLLQPTGCEIISLLMFSGTQREIFFSNIRWTRFELYVLSGKGVIEIAPESASGTPSLIFIDRGTKFLLRSTQNVKIRCISALEMIAVYSSEASPIYLNLLQLNTSLYVPKQNMIPQHPLQHTPLLTHFLMVTTPATLSLEADGLSHELGELNFAQLSSTNRFLLYNRRDQTRPVEVLLVTTYQIAPTSQSQATRG